MNTNNDNVSRKQSPPAAPTARTKNGAPQETKKSLLVQVRSAVKAAGGLPIVDPVC